MKKNMLVLLLILLIPITVEAAGPVSVEHGTYENAQNIIKEIMKSYYNRGSSLQYNYSKAEYGINAPEEATYQDFDYLVCAAFTYGSYVEAFGTKYVKDTSPFPRYNYEISDTAAAYYTANKNNASALDGNYLIYYENTTTDAKAKYVYNNAATFDAFVELIRPGDLFVYSGHALIAYDVVTNPTTGKKDVLILNSTADEYIRTRIDGTSKLSHNFLASPNGNNGYIDVLEEGTIQWIWLSNISSFGSNGNISCTKDECAVLRPFYENENGKAVFNFNIDTTQYTKSELRTQYPGLFIEKTIDVGDNNSVNIGDELTYTITITNKSDLSSSEDYSSFTIEETLGDYVTYVSSDGTKSNNKITWNISSLAAGATKELTYTVKVTENYSNLDKKIVSTGKFYNDDTTQITTGTVENKIVRKVVKQNKTYQECYDSITDESGTDLIDSVYSCVYDSVDFSFADFDFTNIFSKSTATNISKGTSKLVYPTNPENIYYKMILNNYWSGLYQTTDGLFYLPRWSGEYTKDRARTIMSSDLKDGDILLYSVSYDTTSTTLKRTYEDGLYAYIYINGKFVRKNVSVTDDRLEFTHNYYGNSNTISKFTNITDTVCSNYNYTDKVECNYFYNLYGGYSKLSSSNKEEILEFTNYQTLFDKDYYVILRPELLIKESSSIDVKLDKTTYLQNTEELDLSNSSLTLTYNDGTTETVSLTNENVKISGFDNGVLGVNTLIIEYDGLMTTLDLNIVSEDNLPLPDIPDTGATVYLGILLMIGAISIFTYSYLKDKGKLITLK